MYYYEVAPTKIVRTSSDVFTYHSVDSLAIGTLVAIPVGKSKLTGLIMRKVAKPKYETKPIEMIQMAGSDTTLPPPLVELASWMARYYATHLATVLQTILPAGLTKNRRDKAQSVNHVKRNRTHFLLNSDQQRVVESISATKGGTTLLHGITGSGKTAVYAELVRRVLADGRSAIVLVPEIALTSQLVAEFSELFADSVILTHSRQTEAERHLAWLKVQKSTSPLVVIGPRSALFMPLSSVGMIIIDEAHEPSFKQDKAPRYSALRVASMLARYHSAKVIQGTATPLVSEYYYATHGTNPIEHLANKARHDAVDPTITLVDMTKKSHFTRHHLFSNELLEKTEQALANNEQVLLFHNRRGSASTTLCESCGWSATCPRCFIPLTLHADLHRLECHVCGLRERVPTHCPVCQSTDIIHKGIGTKRIESEIARLFPNANIKRFDGDAAKGEGVENHYQALYDGAIDIIIGTQVIAKGLDLPKLRVVGVIQADAGLSLPDFASTERTFQLLAQVVGRVGRSHHASDVIVQSYQPTAPAVIAGIAQDYAAFYAATIDERRRGHFPPFTFLLHLTCVYKTEAAAIRNARELAATLKKDYPNVVIFGPTPAFYERQHDTYRWQLIVRSSDRAQLLEIMKDVPTAHWQADLDPMSLL
jgi:primosomal protein N' (replication factor Y)